MVLFLGLVFGLDVFGAVVTFVSCRFSELWAVVLLLLCLCLWVCFNSGFVFGDGLGFCFLLVVYLCLCVVLCCLWLMRGLFDLCFCLLFLCCVCVGCYLCVLICVLEIWF